MASMIKAEIVCPIVDAKRQNVYTAIYKNGQRILKYSVIPICEILEIIKGRGTLQRTPTFAFTGDGIDVYKDEIIKVLGEKAVFAEKRLWHTSADIIAKLGFRMYNENKGVVKDLSKFQPLYLYPKDVQCRRFP
jgi:tRNA threonylcarbamoyladenosine biosynthesis protein TsaB